MFLYVLDAVQYCKDYCLPMAFSKISGLFNLNHYVEVCLKRTCNLHKWCELDEGQLQVAVTRLLPYFRRERKMTYDSETDLLESLVASAAAFPFAPLVYRHGSWCVDGGLSDFQPIVDSSTVTVSPFYFSRADIKPSRYVPLWWALVPPNTDDTIDWLYHLGWSDGLKWLKKQGIDTSIAKNEPLKNPHPFDTPGTVSLHRFLGYDLDKFGRYLSYLGDAFLFMLLAFIWKPFALLLIYAEVIVLLAFNLGKAVLYELFYVWPLLLLIGYWTRPTVVVAVFVISLLLLHKILIFGPSKANNLEDVWECLSCFSSMKLISKFITPRPSVKKDFESVDGHLDLYHRMLEKTSIFYRIARHFL